MQSKFAKTGLWISLALYVICLTQDGYYIDGADPEAWSPAYGLLFIGWIGIFAGMFAWLANPLLFASWFLLATSRHRAAFFVSLGALLFAMSFLLHSEVISSAAPTYSRIIGYGMGYWLWIASALILVVGAGVLTFRPKSDARTEPRAEEPESIKGVRLE